MINAFDTRAYRWTIGALAVVGITIAVAPIVTIVLLSFSADSGLSFPPSAFSLRWYVAALGQIGSDEAGESIAAAGALLTSVKVGAAVMFFSIVVCVPLAYVLARSKGLAWRSLELLFALPLVFPVVVLGLAFLLTAEASGLELGLFRLIIPHLTLALPFVLRNCMAAMNGIGRDVEEAAMSLGASPVRAIADIVVPMMRPGIVAGLTFAFIVSFNEFTVTYFMYTIDLGTLPLWMYSRTVSSLDPTVLALSSMIILFDLVVILAIDRIAGGRRNLF